MIRYVCDVCSITDDCKAGENHPKGFIVLEMVKLGYFHACSRFCADTLIAAAETDFVREVTNVSC